MRKGEVWKSFLIETFLSTFIKSVQPVLKIDKSTSAANCKHWNSQKMLEHKNLQPCLLHIVKPKKNENSLEDVRKGEGQAK
jgi:hypothetical protein